MSSDNAAGESGISSLAKAFVEFQKELTPIKKDGSADVQTKTGGKFSYSYASLDAIIDHVRPLLAKHGLGFTQSLTDGPDGTTGITTTLLHESGEQDSSTVHVNTQGKTAQECGSLFTYFKRYSLGAKLGIATEEDDDGAAGNTPPRQASGENKPTASPHKAPSKKQLDLIWALATGQDHSDEEIRDVLARVKSSADASQVIERLKSKEAAV